MRVTSFEISKKLAEIGFKSNHFGAYVNGELALYCALGDTPYYVAYDLETILTALPKDIQIIINGENGDCIMYNPLGKDEIFLDKHDDESLVDCAARLLILLEFKGLVNFNKDNNKE